MVKNVFRQGVCKEITHFSPKSYTKKEKGVTVPQMLGCAYVFWFGGSE